MPASSPDFLTDVLARFLRGESVDHYLAPEFVGLGGLLGSNDQWHSVDDVSTRLNAKGDQFQIALTERTELGDGRVYLSGTASRTRAGSNGFAVPFGALVALADGLIQTIQTAHGDDAMRAEAGLPPRASA